MLSISRAAIAATAAVALSACSGGGGGSVFNPNPITSAQCNPGTSVAITRPQSNTFGVSANIGSIEIALANQNNPVWSNPSSWTLALQTSNFGQIAPVGGNLTTTSDPSGPHPFPNDFYLTQGIGQLQAGVQYNVYLEQTFAGCAPVQIGSFST